MELITEPRLDLLIRNYRVPFDNASPQGRLLATGQLEPLTAASLAPNGPPGGISKYINNYEYIHLIGHSTGAKLIDVAAEELALISKLQVRNPEDRPFIHLTFLDAFTPREFGYTGEYGLIPKYPKRFSEHYVDRTNPAQCNINPDVINDVLECVRNPALASVCVGYNLTMRQAECAAIYHYTSDDLDHASNFDITDWFARSKPQLGHHWPRRWYEGTVVRGGFKYGHALSLEGGSDIETLPQTFRPGSVCTLKDRKSKC